MEWKDYKKELLKNPKVKEEYNQNMDKKRDIGQEILEGIRAIKNGEGKKFKIELPPDKYPAGQKGQLNKIK